MIVNEFSSSSYKLINMSITSKQSNLVNNLNSSLNFEKLSKYRIIQKNLVHFQGFPDDIYNEKILSSPGYFGQYGKIKKVCLVPKNELRPYNSAYITFEKDEYAAYCILAVDSIKIKNDLVRAFFGTTKYCNNFLRGYLCMNQKCKFRHYLADNKKDIAINDIKFGYSEHINLAKKIIGFGTQKSLEYIKENVNLNENHILPDIRNIYSFQHIKDKNKNHRRKQSSLSNNSTSNSYNSVNSENKDIINENKIIGIQKGTILNKKKDNVHFENDDIFNIIKSLLKRKFFFKQFDNFEFAKSLNKQFEQDLYNNFLDKL